VNFTTTEATRQQLILDLHSTGTWPLPRSASFTHSSVRLQTRPLGNRPASPSVAKRSRTNGSYWLDFWDIESPHKSEERFINPKTADALSLTIPQYLLVTVNEVIP
jgi:hypothetical protein